MTSLELELASLASHPTSAVLAALLVARRSGHWVGPAFLGLLLGWGSLPLVLLLSREARPETAVRGHGFSPSERAEGGSDWDQWRSYYYNLRQDLIIQIFLLMTVVVYVGFVVCLLLVPQFVQWVDFLQVGSLVWGASHMIPVLFGLLLMSGYRLPWLGSVWRFSDEIWRNSGLVVPAEVHWRHPGGPTLSQEEARLGLLEAVSRSHRLHQLTFWAWCLLLGLLGVGILWSILEMRQHY